MNSDAANTAVTVLSEISKTHQACGLSHPFTAHSMPPQMYAKVPLLQPEDESSSEPDWTAHQEYIATLLKKKTQKKRKILCLSIAGSLAAAIIILLASLIYLKHADSHMAAYTTRPTPPHTPPAPATVHMHPHPAAPATTHKPKPKTKLPPPPLDCGTTLASAKHNRCHFEPMLSAWVPHDCFYLDPARDPIYSTYLSKKTWYLDPGLKTPAPSILFRSGEFEILYTESFHRWHCLYIWRKMSLAIKRKVEWVDSSSAAAGHAEHCVGRLGGWIEGVENEGKVGRNHSAVSVQFLKCVKAPWLA